MLPSPSPRRLFLLFGLLFLALPVRAQQQSCSAETLGSAEEAYQESDFERAIALLTPCLARNAFAGADAIRAHRLLSMAHLNNGDAYGARLAIQNLLRLDPTYEPDPVQDPPSYTVLVLVIKEQMMGERSAAAPDTPQGSWTKKRSTWLAIGGGLVVVGLAAIFTGTSGN